MVADMVSAISRWRHSVARIKGRANGLAVGPQNNPNAARELTKGNLA